MHIAQFLAVIEDTSSLKHFSTNFKIYVKLIWSNLA